MGHEIYENKDSTLTFNNSTICQTCADMSDEMPSKIQTDLKNQLHIFATQKADLDQQETPRLLTAYPVSSN